ncbi:MAG: chorismate mutase, partial [Erysipelotrichaceae bacterium]|nr:chorismate mutase [Erysipelotrichaceae bacterium]
MESLEEIRKTLDEIDYQMAVLFEKRMRQIEKVIAYKKEHALPTEDVQREVEMIERNLCYIQSPIYREYYVQMIRKIIALSKDYQQKQ